MNEADLADLQQKLGFSFHNPALLREALVHGSFANENPHLAPVTNERLEFLGDAVLGLVIAAKLYGDFPDMSEGEMTKFRARLVRGDTLARVAAGIGLGSYLLLGKGEEASGGRSKRANLARALEAVIGAAYLDQGLDAAGALIARLLEVELKTVATRGTTGDYKSELQELLQERQQQTPSYHVVATTGPDHDKTFVVEVRLGEAVLGRGSGKSKKAAETAAAHETLKRLLAGQDDFTR